MHAWNQWDEVVLPLRTKKQLSEAGYQTGKKLPPPAALVPHEKSPIGFMRAYDPSQATPKRNMTEAQKATLEKARYVRE